MLDARATDFSWPGHGTITFDVPPNWSLDGKQTAEISYGFQARPKSGAAAIAQVTLVELAPGKSIAPTEVKSQLEKWQAHLSSTGEKAFVPRPLPLARGTGWFVEFTDASFADKPPVPRDYKVLRNALLAPDDRTMVAVTMQFDDPNGPEPAEMLALVSSLRLARKEGPAPLTVPSVDGYYQFTVPESRMLLQIPASGLAESHDRLGATANNPRYFKFAGNSPNLIISGWFEPAERYKDPKKFWADEIDGIKKSGQPKAQNVTFLKVGPWDVIAYEMDLGVPGMTNAHLRAEAVQAGTWLDLHLSTTSKQPATASREQLLATLRTLRLTEKP